MKKILLFALLVCFLAVNAQQSSKMFHAWSAKKPVTCGINEKVSVLPAARIERSISGINYQSDASRETKFVNPIPIGQSGNAFGFAFMRTTYLWADNNTNAITFIHRMAASPGTGYLAYDVSKDGGQTWTNNVQAYDPTLPDAYNGRYPQGAIYNPVGNTDPDNAYFHYFAPTLDGSNIGAGTDWGGYCYGTKQLAEGSTPVQNNRTSTPPYYQYLPSAFTVTQAGEAWMVDENTQGDPTTFNYLGSLILGRGIWDVDLSDFVYDFQQFPLDIHPDDGINDIKIAFGPDGMTGYICVMTNLPEMLPYTSYHPILFKTTDGGDTWSDPIEVQLGGADGLPEVINFITDERLSAFFDPDPVPPRDEIDYYLGYECDLAVDAWGNPHISGMVCIADNDAGSIYTGEGIFAMFHIWSDDQGETWNAFNLGDLKRFSAEFGSSDGQIVQYNRPQVATTMDGAIVFFSWLDTESPDVEDNSNPDIFFREYFPTQGVHGEAAENVTYLSAAFWVSYFGCMSHYVFSDVTDNEQTYVCTIPFVYEEMNNNDPLLPVQFHYIPDFVKTYTITGLDKPGLPPIANVSQNYPNPFSTTSVIKVNLLQDSRLTVDIYNITGSLIRTIDFGEVSKGIHDVNMNAEGLSRGIYFYSVNTGTARITKKMIIQ